MTRDEAGTVLELMLATDHTLFSETEKEAIRTAVELLKEQPQEGCKWCSRKPVFSGSYCLNGDNEETLADGDWTVLYMGCDEIGRIRLTACGDGRADYYPKFCPECGKPVNRN